VNTVSEAENSPARSGLLPTQRVRWGLPDVAVGAVLTAAIIGGQTLLARAPWFPHLDWLGVTLQTLFYLIIAAFLVVVSKTRGLGRIRLDFGFELRWIDLLIGVGLAIVLQIASVLVNQIAFDLLRLPVAPTGNVSLPKSPGWAVFDGLAIASFLAPVVEELFFRGLVMRTVRNLVVRRSKIEGPRTTRRAARISILVSALMFAAAHLYESRNLTMLFVLGVWIFIVGLVTGAIATRTGRLGPSMITHILTNGLATVLLLTGAQ
jgi:membrane protease YdiL (CAAX protease family)